MGLCAQIGAYFEYILAPLFPSPVQWSQAHIFVFVPVALAIQTTMKILLNSLLAFACLPHPSFAADAPPTTTSASQVVFICDHGSAKSMIAASYFNQIASRRGLPYRAISRGIAPDAELQPATRQGLQQDGISTEGLTPTTITPEVADAARRVITITVESTPSFIQRDKLEEWNDIPAVSKDYGASRDAMVRKLEQLIANLTTTQR